MSRQGRRLRWTGIGFGGITVVTVTLGLTWRFWSPNWASVMMWLEAWWWALVAAATAVVGSVAFTVSWRPPHQVASEPAPTSTLAPASAEGSGKRWNWSGITSAITAFTALAALLFTALSLSATRDQINVAEQGQIADRYAKAIDQLGTQGDEHLDTRLGGIYELERLARDSPRDQPTIVDVLSAFIRSSLPRPNPPLHSGERPEAGSCSSVAMPHSLSLDAQAALTVLGRRDHAQDDGTVTDLHNTCLSGLDLTDVDLSGADLSGADLTDADLHDADLADADLNEAHLDEADLSGARISDAKLAFVHAAGARFSDSDLDQASLAGANLDNANLTHANLTDADLSDVILTSTDLFGAALDRATLRHADLADADLSDTLLTNADLTGATLAGATHDRYTQTGGATTNGAEGLWW